MLDRASIEPLLLARVLAGLSVKLAAIDALLLAIKARNAFNPLLLAFELLRTFLALNLASDALLLAFELRRAVLALDLAFNALRSLEALPFLALDLTFDALLLAFDPLRALGPLNLLPFHALRLLDALHLLTFGALRTFGSLRLFAAAPGRLGLRRGLALAFLFGKRGNRQSHAGDSGDQDHLAGHG